MSRHVFLLTHALSLAALLSLANTAAHAAGPGNRSVFYCDKRSVEKREEEIHSIRHDVLPNLQEVIDDPSTTDDKLFAIEQRAEYLLELKELELGLDSCKELRAFERGGRRPRRNADDDRLAASRPPKKPLAEDDDELLAPPLRPGVKAPMPVPDPDYYEQRPDYEPYDPTPYDPKNPNGVTPPKRPNS